MSDPSNLFPLTLVVIYCSPQFPPPSTQYLEEAKGNRLSDGVAKFFVANVVLALEYLHERDIIHRDVKPENLVLGPDGYLTLVDYGLSKDISQHPHSYTFCGTPDYIAPEVLMHQGHGKPVDLWAVRARTKLRIFFSFPKPL